MRWRTLPSERIDLPLVVVVRPVDSFLGRAPALPVEYRVQLVDPVPDPLDSGRDLGATALRTPSGRVLFPELRLPAAVRESYRLSTRSPFLLPSYPPGADAFMFTLAPGTAAGAVDVVLHPGPAYPFPPPTPVAHGVVHEGDQPAAAALVTSSAGDRCATDERGRFSLALRAVRRAQPVSVIVTTRTGRVGQRDFADREEAINANIAIQVPSP